MRTRFWIIITLLTISLFSNVETFAQTGPQRLFSHADEEGTMYFINAKKLSNLENIKGFEFDITYLDYTDSATINFTIISSNPNDVSALQVGNGQTEVTATDVELLYHEMKGKNYVVRTTSKVPYLALKEMMTAQSPLVFNVTRADGQRDMATYKPSQWKKERDLFERIIFLINK